ncbi:MAG TPA: hypothetical protein VFW98_04505 [Gemmatimonadaceae bacterium]|nr:hypothetical protein [Gemmatimonadaceae bacterium]
MRALAVVALAAVLAGCGRKVEVKTAPQPANQIALDVTNNAAVGMNVDVINGGNDIFLGQVAANSTKLMPVPGLPSGTTVTLKATATDGSHTYSKAGVVLSGMYAWTVP